MSPLPPPDLYSLPYSDMPTQAIEASKKCELMRTAGHSLTKGSLRSSMLSTNEAPTVISMGMTFSRALVEGDINNSFCLLRKACSTAFSADTAPAVPDKQAKPDSTHRAVNNFLYMGFSFG